MATTIRITVDDAEVKRGLRESSKEVNRDLKDAMGDVARGIALPRARALAPSIARASLTSGSTSKTGYLTTRARGVQRSIFALQEFGGTIRTPLRPKNAKALRLRDGTFVAAVNAPRKIQGRHFMREAVLSSQGEINRAIEARVTDVIQDAVGRL